MFRARNTDGKTGRSRHAWAAGAAFVPGIGMATAALTARWWPDGALAGTLGRLADSAAPQLALAAIAFGLLGLVLGSRRGAGLVLVLALAAAGLLAGRHWQQSAGSVPAPGLPSELTVLWFNMLNGNTTPAEQLTAALAASPADLVIIAEPAQLRPHLTELADTFPVVAGCRRACGILVLARNPAVRVSFRSPQKHWPERMVTISTGDGRPDLTVLALHLVKPWFYGFTEHDTWHVYDALRRITGPVLVTGDFNSAPWSRPLQELISDCALSPARRPVPTWPLALGPAGIPIDNMLVRGGAKIHGPRPWGGALGSNHRGLIAGISVDPDSPARGSSHGGCQPEGPQPG